MYFSAFFASFFALLSVLIFVFLPADVLIEVVRFRWLGPMGTMNQSINTTASEEEASFLAEVWGGKSGERDRTRTDGERARA